MAQLNFKTLLLIATAFFSLTSFTVAAKKPIKAAEVSSVNKQIIKRNYAAAFMQLKANADNGDANAQLKLANMYRLGLGTKRDDAIAQSYYEAAAQAGNKEAILVLNRMHVAVPATEKAKVSGASAKTIDVIEYGKLPKRGPDEADWLTLAAARGDVKAIKALVQQSPQTENSAMLAATKSAKIEIVSALAAGGVKSSADALGRTPAMLAVSTGNTELLDAVLRSKVDISAKNKLGLSAAALAAQTCQTKILEKLLEAGAVLDEKNDTSPTLPIIARDCSNWSEFKRFFAKADMNVVDGSGRSAAWYAAQKGDVPLLGWLAEQGANLALADKQGLTPVHVAAMSKQLLSLKFILSKMDSADIPASRGTTPMMLAAYVGCAECVDSLIKKKADVNLKNIDGDTSLMFAVRGLQGQIAQNLLEAGSNPDARNAAGDTPKKLGERLGIAYSVPAN